jgi:hypothetical protein
MFFQISLISLSLIYLFIELRCGIFITFHCCSNLLKLRVNYSSFKVSPGWFFFFYWAWMIVTIWNQWSMTDPAFSLYYDFFLHISYASLLEWESSFRTNFNPHFGIFFYFSFCLLLYCMVLYLDALVGGCYCQKWPSKNVNSYNWLLLVIKSPYLLV